MVAHIMEDVKEGKNLNIEAVRGVVEPDTKQYYQEL